MTKEKLKKTMLIILLVIAIIIFSILSYIIIKNILHKTRYENSLLEIANKNERTIFSIDNIVYFSSCNADTSIKSNSSVDIKNLYQYTDIAIYINSGNQESTYENTLKELRIENIKFNTLPSLGTPQLYYKNINYFAASTYSEENKINDSLQFNITSENEANLDTPILYNNCANPITLSYINNNIKTDYTLDDTTNQITYDGSLLKQCNVTLNSISADISFDILIKNNLDQEFICPVYLQIPLGTSGEKSIYDGKYLLKDKPNYTFYRYN